MDNQLHFNKVNHADIFTTFDSMILMTLFKVSHRPSNDMSSLGSRMHPYCLSFLELFLSHCTYMSSLGFTYLQACGGAHAESLTVLHLVSTPQSLSHKHSRLFTRMLRGSISRQCISEQECKMLHPIAVFFLY